MFVCSVKAGTLKFTGILLLAAALLSALLLTAVPAVTTASAGGRESYTYTGAGTEEGRKKFLAQFGWEVGEPIENVSFTLPEEFDRVMLGYNEIQRAQGLDLSRYRKKSVTRYTYEVANYEGADGRVYANLIIYRGRVIGGDICSADPSGFVHGFKKENLPQ